MAGLVRDDGVEVHRVGAAVTGPVERRVVVHLIEAGILVSVAIDVGRVAVRIHEHERERHAEDARTIRPCERLEERERLPAGLHDVGDLRIRSAAIRSQEQVVEDVGVHAGRYRDTLHRCRRAAAVTPGGHAFLEIGIELRRRHQPHTRPVDVARHRVRVAWIEGVRDTGASGATWITLHPAVASAALTIIRNQCLRRPGPGGSIDQKLGLQHTHSGAGQREVPVHLREVGTDDRDLGLGGLRDRLGAHRCFRDRTVGGAAGEHRRRSDSGEE